MVERLARIEATAGLQTSQPRPVPCAATTSSKRRWPCTATVSKSSCRVRAKCSHRLRSTSRPAAAKCSSTIVRTSGLQEPQVVPARVQALTQATSAHGFSARATASTICALVTSLQEQTCASSGSPTSAPPRLAGRIRSSGFSGSSMPLDDHRPQHAVRRGVADQDAAEQRCAVPSAVGATTSFL